MPNEDAYMAETDGRVLHILAAGAVIGVLIGVVATPETGLAWLAPVGLLLLSLVVAVATIVVAIGTAEAPGGAADD